MAFAAKFFAGGATAGVLTLFYRNEIEQTTGRLSADLHKLAGELADLAPKAEQKDVWSYGIPERIPFGEQVKARWNEKLIYGITTLQNTSWTNVAASTFASAKSGLSSLQSQLSGQPSTTIASDDEADHREILPPATVMPEKTPTSFPSADGARKLV